MDLEKIMESNEKTVEKRIKEGYSLNGIERALEIGCIMRGFRSGGGLKVVRIEQNVTLKGYGEHPFVNHALYHANEDFLAGRRDYKDVYGGKYPHYLTGSRDVISPLDEWLRKGEKFNSFKVDDIVIFKLKGHREVETPEDIIWKLNEGEDNILWTHRGYTYETSNHFLAGSIAYSTKVIGCPEGKSEKGSGPWMYEITKTGKADNFYDAMGAAFKAEEKEVGGI
jgi:hypothetical protein